MKNTEINLTWKITCAINTFTHQRKLNQNKYFSYYIKTFYFNIQTPILI